MQSEFRPLHSSGPICSQELFTESGNWFILCLPLASESVSAMLQCATVHLHSGENQILRRSAISLHLRHITSSSRSLNRSEANLSSSTRRVLSTVLIEWLNHSSTSQFFNILIHRGVHRGVLTRAVSAATFWGQLFCSRSRCTDVYDWIPLRILDSIGFHWIPQLVQAHWNNC